jgi:hypothetical protein
MRGGHRHGGGGGFRGGFGGPGFRGGPGPFGPPAPMFGFGPPVGVFGGGRFCRRGPPPRFGRHGYWYNYPGLVMGSAIVAGAVVASSCRHNVYVRNRQQITVINSSAPVRRYYVDVPADVYPGETFRVVLDGEEVIITCPEVSGPGERIIVSVEVNNNNGNNVGVAPAQVVHSTTAYSNNSSNGVYPTGSVVSQSAPPTAPSMPVATTVNYNNINNYDGGTYATPTSAVESSNANSNNTSNHSSYKTNYDGITSVSGVSPFSGFSALPAPTTASTTSAVGNNNNNNNNNIPIATAVVTGNDVPSCCPQCTFSNPSAARFCSMCGGALGK